MQVIGDTFSRASVEALVEQFKLCQKDGGTLLISQGGT
jgi:hypothetical protein